MTKTFTKSFFRLSDNDRLAVVDAVICDLESCIGRHLNPDDDRRTERQIERIQRRAIEHGVYSE